MLGELGLPILAAGSSEERFGIELLAGPLPAAETVLRQACKTLDELGEKGFLSTRCGLSGALPRAAEPSRPGSNVHRTGRGADAERRRRRSQPHQPRTSGYSPRERISGRGGGSRPRGPGGDRGLGTIPTSRATASSSSRRSSRRPAGPRRRLPPTRRRSRCTSRRRTSSQPSGLPVPLRCWKGERSARGRGHRR